LKPALSIVSPVYRSEKIIDELVTRIVATVERLELPFEIVLVDDRSPDASWERIAKRCHQDPRVKGVRLSRNFGQHAAITAGLRHTQGDWVVVMDCDLQDNPAYIPQLLAQARSTGAQIVYTAKSQRQHSSVKNLQTRLFNGVFNWLVDDRQNLFSDSSIGSFSLISRRVVDAFLSVGDVKRHYLLTLRWLGFSSTTLPIEHEARFEGRSSYSFSRLIRHAVEGITAHSTRLLTLAISLGFLCFLAAFSSIAYLVVMYFLHGYKEGWASTFVLILFSTGLILVTMGIVGLYIGNIFEQVKGRPLFVVEEWLNAPSHPERRE
jgi:glycosyltransferase involved in cell wall biosynthesis